MIRIFSITTALLSGACIYFLLCKGKESQLVKAFKDFNGFVRKKSRTGPFYERTEEKLIKKGAGFHFYKGITTYGFVAIKVLLFTLTGITCLSVNIPTAFCIAVFAYFLPDILLEYMNRSDNEKMLPDLKLIFNSLVIQIRAGVYAPDALAETALLVNEKRLKQGLTEFAGDLLIKADTKKSLAKLSAKFENVYIDFLMIGMLQSLESGRVVELLNDIADQIRDIETETMEKKKQRLNRKVTLYQLGVLAAVLTIVIYGSVLNMFTITQGI